ncbi:MAG TPA: hypothetical protein VGW12_09525 [Pyrinomonadaceae bacterium]|nr:hypothetical protein [Pyrinomonadaceae bacterium]
MRKVLVIGSGGAGKSTFAHGLGQLLGLEVIHLDRLYRRAELILQRVPNWRMMPALHISTDGRGVSIPLI